MGALPVERRSDTVCERRPGVEADLVAQAAAAQVMLAWVMRQLARRSLDRYVLFGQLGADGCGGGLGRQQFLAGDMIERIGQRTSRRAPVLMDRR